jgi:hypothetical protein
MPRVLGIKTAANVELQEVWDYDGGVTAESDPSLIPKVQYYKHFNLTDEELGWTRRYNCWGFTFLPRRYWINSDSDVDQILNDNCSPVAPGSLRPGDVIRYRDSNNVTTHTGRVWEVDATGNCATVRSKWGSMAEYVHAPTDPYIYNEDAYGTNLAYFRQHGPLRGIIGDLWIMDANNDNGQQYSNSLWASPDILVDAPPYGSVDVNPVFGKVNRVWAMVQNRSDADITTARVRYYWANPFAGFAPSNWQLIPGTVGHPNPTNTFTVAGNSSATAPFVEWVPVPQAGVPDQAHQCLLAIAFVNDDPKDSSNPDPIVYPFNIRWDNNIAARNVHIVHMKKGGKTKLQIATGVPFDKVEKINLDLRIRLAFVPRLPIFGYPTKVIPPKVSVTLGERRPFTLQITKELSSSLSSIRMMEKTVAMRELRRLPLISNKPVPIHLEITAPSTAQEGSNFYLRVEQLFRGQITGCYTVVISIT